MQRFARQIFRVSAAGFAFVSFGIGTMCLAWLVLPILSLWGSRPDRFRRCQRMVQRAFVLLHDYLRWTGLIEFNPRAPIGELAEGACVIVANHPTLIDVAAIIAAYGELCVVAKTSLFRNPLIGPLLRCCGHIRSDRIADSPGDSADQGHEHSIGVLVEGVERLKEGHRVLLFPEGTRSGAEGMRRFRNGAFHLAVRGHVPVQALCLRAEPPALKKGDHWYRIPDRTMQLTLRVLPPTPTENTMDIRGLSNAVRAQIQTAINEHDDRARVLDT